MTVGEMEHGRGTPMSSREMTEWRVYYQIKAAEFKEKYGNGGSDTPPVMGS